MIQTISTSSPPATAPSPSSSPETTVLESEIRRLRGKVEELERLLAYQGRATHLLARPLPAEA